MKKWIAFLLALLICASACACESQNKSGEESKEMASKIEKFIDGFQFAEFERFNSTAKDNGLGGAKVYLQGEFERTELLDIDTGYAILGYFHDADGNQWLVNMHTTELVSSNFYEDIMGENCYIRGEYSGYSTVYNMPFINMEELLLTDTGDTYPGIQKLSTYDKQNTADAANSDQTPPATPEPTPEPTPAVHVNFTTKQQILDAIETETEQLITSMDTAYKTLLPKIEKGFEDYGKNKKAVEEFYAVTLDGAAKLYLRYDELSLAYYRLVSKEDLGKYSAWDKALDKLYDKWDSCMDDLYDALNDTYDALYEVCDDIIDDAYEVYSYAECSDAWSDMYETWSDAWSEMYNDWSDAWSKGYSNWSDVWSGFYNEETDVDKILN